MHGIVASRDETATRCQPSPNAADVNGWREHSHGGFGEATTIPPVYLLPPARSCNLHYQLGNLCCPGCYAA